MNNHRFTLEPYKGMKTRHVCPGCGKKGVFVRYIDQATGEPLAATVGRCNRETNCGYHYKPGEYFRDNEHLLPEQIRGNWTPPPPEPPKPTSYIDPEIFKASRAGYDQNNFVKWLLTLFDETTTAGLISRYHLGTSKYYPGAVVFWQVDQAGRIRSGKIMGYDPDTGHRIKEPFPQFQWTHKALNIDPFNLRQCFFGEHLLTLDTMKPVGIAESEKTAIVATGYLPGLVWLAAGGLEQINIEKCKPLAGRRVVLFPDLGGFEKWSQKAAELQKAIPGTRFDVSDILERGATSTDRENGLDLCDYLTKFNWRTFAGNNPPTQQPETRGTDQEPEQIRVEYLKSENGEKSEAVKTNYFSPQEPKPTKPTKATPLKNEIWQVDELETFFAGVQLPREPIRVNRWTLITDVSKFIENQLTETRAHNGNPYFKPGFDRLIELKNILLNTGQKQIL